MSYPSSCLLAPTATLMFLPRHYFVLLTFAVVGCRDSTTNVVPSSHPVLNSSVAYAGEHELDYDWQQGNFFGLFPVHPEFTLPPGEYDVQFDVTGGITWQPEGMRWVRWTGDPFVGPGGTKTGGSSNDGSEVRVFQVSLVREEVVRGRVTQRTVWSAPPVGGDRAEGKMRVRGGARFYFVRYSPGTSSVLLWESWLRDALYTHRVRKSELWSSNQRVRVVATPVAADPLLSLECTGDLDGNRVTRGENIVCFAKAGDSLAEVESWSFTGVDSHGQPYSYPDEFDGPITQNPWSGQMAISGVIKVRARVNRGAVQEKTASIAVEPRNWNAAEIRAGVTKVRWEDFPQPDRPSEYPTWVRDLGKVSQRVVVLGAGGEMVTEIRDQGPNNYLAMFARVPIEVDAKILVHPEMESRGDFWRRQAERAPTLSPGAQPPCIRQHFDRYVQQIQAHEGLPLNPASHAGVLIAELQRVSGPAVEGLVYLGTELRAMSDEAEDRLLPLIEQALLDSGDPVDQAFPVRFGCTFNYDKGPRR